MSCQKFKELLAGLQDGELEESQRLEVETHLKRCADCREELARLEKVKEVTGKVQYNDLPLEVWDSYWQSLYRRVERGASWVLISLGAALLLGTGLFYLVRDFFMDSAIAIIPKVGVGALIVGGSFLLVSVARERLFAYNRDRYKEVIR